MADVTVKRLEDFECAGGSFFKARAGLGVSSFGMQYERFPPSFDGYPEHDHAGDGQEEVYIATKGSATLLVGGDEIALEPGVFARVGPHEKRKLMVGADGFEMLAVGGTPGRSYAPPAFTEETGGSGVA